MTGKKAPKGPRTKAEIDADDLTIPDFLLRDTPEKEERARQAWKDYDMAKAKKEAEAQAEEAKTSKAKGKGGKTDAKTDAKTDSKPAKGSKEKAPAEKPAKKSSAPKGEKDEFGFRVGSLKSRAAGLYARKEGATREEVVAELQSSQLNLLKELEGTGNYTVKKEKEEGSGKKPVTRYFLKRSKK